MVASASQRRPCSSSASPGCVSGRSACGAEPWSACSVAIAPLMTRYTASRISAYALTIGAILLLIVGAPQLAAQDYASLPGLVWVAYVFAVLGPLCLTNLLWFNSIEQVGPSRASLYANLQ